ncbi:protein HEXIM-like protein [Dinothrombium tinctorium]|uniref:Protein HEXIM-like protein n=1 Tax=Dinothrombium tinctorium TaxID=1965070 RepID=A0A443RGZ4_9ACAR|nr:protein HEXIM-like protein [Dinothrombium tinctorium]
MSENEKVTNTLLTNNDAINETIAASDQSLSREEWPQATAQNSKPTRFAKTGESEKDAKDQKKRKPRTRRHKWRRRWKPYYKLPLDERRKGESNKVDLFRTRLQQHLKPLAPYNTTQFLMDDHNVREPDFEEINKMIHFNHSNEPRRRCQSESANTDEINEATSSDEFYSSPDDEQDFMQKQFFETYENIHAERLNSMSKSELMQEYLKLEERMEELERKLREANVYRTPDQDSRDADTNEDANDEEMRKTDLLNELKRLKEENARLQQRNEKLECIMKVRSEQQQQDVVASPKTETILVESNNAEGKAEAGSQRSKIEEKQREVN